MQYSLSFKNETTGVEEKFATAEYNNNVISLCIAIPTPKQPWWYKYKELVTPALLVVMMLIKRS